MKWSRNYEAYIGRLLHYDDISLALQECRKSQDFVETWEPPVQPEISFYKTQYPSPIPRTIRSRPKNHKSQPFTKQVEIDNQTTATAVTTWSLSQNEISELQTDYRHQLSATH
jgi:hypothetical protein